MRIARKLTLLAMLAVAATALAAPSAFAQAEPELHNQTPRLIAAQEVHAANDVACPAVVPTPPVAVSPTVTSGGCRIHVASAGTIAFGAHVGGGVEVPISECNIEFDIRIDAAAEGWISHQEFTQGATGTCTRQACGQVTPPTSEGRAYSFHMSEVEPPARTEFAEILLCMEPIGQTQPSHCEFRAPIIQPTTHRYRFVPVDAVGHGPVPNCEFTGTFDGEAALGTTGEGQAEQNIEIRHT